MRVASWESNYRHYRPRYLICDPCGSTVQFPTEEKREALPEVVPGELLDPRRCGGPQSKLHEQPVAGTGVCPGTSNVVI
jgi:hypothetical protein